MKIGDSASEPSFAEYEAIFRGEVLSGRYILFTSDDEENEIYQVAVFRVSTLWKGKVGPIALVFTGSGAGDCGYLFKPGTEYFVFARSLPKPDQARLHTGNTALWTDICTPSAPAADSLNLHEQLSTHYTPEEFQVFENIY